MPWCDDCSKFWDLDEMASAAECPQCRRELGAGAPAVAQGRQTLATAGQSTSPVPEPPSGSEGRRPVASTRPRGAPWHFKVLVVGVTVYMVYRVYWLVEWLPKHI